MSKLKKIMATVMSIMLVMCVGYYSFMSPTSAWFYESGVIDSKDTFVFGDLSVRSDFKAKSKVTIDAATKLADPDEKLFDSAVNVNVINVKNNGTIPARIYTDVTNVGKANGLRWFFFTDSMLVNGSIKETIKANVSQLNIKGLDQYNLGSNGQGGKYILIKPGEVVGVKIATWFEYDEVSSAISKGETVSSDIEITVYATQDKDGALTR